MAVDKRTKAAGESVGFLVVAGLILVVLNVLGVVWFGRIDCTEARIYSLSEGSKRLAASLNDELKITAYFTADLPPPFNATERYVRDILSEYEAASRGRITVRFVNPDDEEEQQEAQEAGVRRVAHQAIEQSAVQVKEGYRGMVLEYLDKKETLPVIETTEGIEYRITTALKEMVGEKTKVGVLSGYGGPTPSEGLSTLRELLPTYELVEVEAVELDPAEYRAALVVGVDQPLGDATLRALDSYVMRGGSLGFFGGSMKVAIEGSAPVATPVDSGVNELLTKWGVRMRSGIVADAECARAPMRTQFGLTLPVPHPPLPRVGFDEAQSEHPVLFRLPAAVFPFTAPLAVNDDTVKGLDGVEVDVLAESSEISWVLDGERIDLSPRDSRQWRGRQDGPLPLMVAVEGKLPSAFAGDAMSGAEGDAPAGPARAEQGARVLVVGGAFLIRDEALPKPNQAGEVQVSAGVALALNAVDWLAQDSDLIAIRAKNVEDPPLEVPSAVQEAQEAQQAAQEKALEADREGDVAEVEAALEQAEAAEAQAKDAIDDWEAKRNLYQYGNMLGIPIAFALFGVIRWQLRKRKRETLKV